VRPVLSFLMLLREAERLLRRVYRALLPGSCSGKRRGCSGVCPVLSFLKPLREEERLLRRVYRALLPGCCCGKRRDCCGVCTVLSFLDAVSGSREAAAECVPCSPSLYGAAAGSGEIVAACVPCSPSWMLLREVERLLRLVYRALLTHAVLRQVYRALLPGCVGTAVCR
jgi:hypothetical protein